MCRYAKKHAPPTEYVFKIEEEDGVGFAYINKKKDWLKNGEVFDTSEELHPDWDYTFHLHQIRAGLFIHKSKNEFASPEKLRETILREKGFQEVSG